MLQLQTTSIRKNEYSSLAKTTELPGKLRIATETHVYYLATDDIIRIQSLSNYSKVFFSSGETLTVSKVLAYFDDLLVNSNFLRIHRTHLINLFYLKHFVSGNLPQATLSNNENIPVSRRRKKMLLQKMLSLSL